MILKDLILWYPYKSWAGLWFSAARGFSLSSPWIAEASVAITCRLKSVYRVAVKELELSYHTRFCVYIYIERASDRVSPIQ